MPEIAAIEKQLMAADGCGACSGTESDSDETIPELEETGAAAAGASSNVYPSSAAGLAMDMVSKAKQSRGEKKARKIMSKLGLKPVCLVSVFLIAILIELL